MPIERLRAGDLVLTRDTGPQPLCWISSRHLDRDTLRAMPDLRPIFVSAELVRTEAPLLVSPQQGAGKSRRRDLPPHLGTLRAVAR